MEDKHLLKLFQVIKDTRFYKLPELFQSRDALNILAGYGLADMELIKEVELYILQLGSQKEVV